MTFWDSSALVPLFLEEPASSSARTIARADPYFIVWTLAPVEIWGAACRRRRAGDIDETTLAAIRKRIAKRAAGWSLMPDSAALRSEVERVLHEHDLRAADALQLAAAVVAFGGAPRKRPFVCADDRLLAAARAEGFATIRPA